MRHQKLSLRCTVTNRNNDTAKETVFTVVLSCHDQHDQDSCKCESQTTNILVQFEPVAVVVHRNNIF